ncbi:hypothetical protein BJY52DRAFT_1225924 [Lactarius psammicola]|nr:hypothetical protein BJY52DRAFT_1225924 [Lactarius psammicola]
MSGNQMKTTSLRKTSGGSRYSGPIGLENFRLGKSIIVNFYRTFQLLLFDRLALLIDLGNSLAFQAASGTSFALGLLYLTYGAFPIIFGEKHHFYVQMTGLTFIDPRKHGDPPPEFRLLIGQTGAVLVSGSLFCMAFTAYFYRMYWIAPTIASIPLGIGIDFVFTSSLSYLVVAYRPVAASAMASNSAMRSTFGATFPLFIEQVYHRPGIVGATALLAVIATLPAPFP